MIYRIEHTTEYQYEEKVGLTPQWIRLFPRLDDRIRLREYRLNIFPQGTLHWVRDPFDNVVAKFFTTEISRQFTVTVQAEIEHRQQSAFDFLLDSAGMEVPPAYSEQEKLCLDHYMEPGTDSGVSQWLESTPASGIRESVPFLSECADEIHGAFEYIRRDEPGTQSAEETLTVQSGTCRDFALFMMMVCRERGIASRFVSGYIHAEPDSENSPSADAIHAWIEVFLPGAGWRGIDPTNGIWCNQNHIPLAVGLVPDETTPIEGTYCADHKVASRMETQLHLQNPACHPPAK